LIYTIAQLIDLAQNSPEELSRVLTSPGADIKMLVAGAELLCEETTDETLILPVIRQLLKHTHALVRESAMIGVTSFYENKKPPADVISRLKVISNSDPSAQLKSYAKDILESFPD